LVPATANAPEVLRPRHYSREKGRSRDAFPNQGQRVEFVRDNNIRMRVQQLPDEAVPGVGVGDEHDKALWLPDQLTPE
jgi:hypothetical protein